MDMQTNECSYVPERLIYRDRWVATDLKKKKLNSSPIFCTKFLRILIYYPEDIHLFNMKDLCSWSLLRI